MYLYNSNGWSESGLYLSQMDDACDADDLQHAVPVVRRRELVVFLRAPHIRPAAPAARKGNAEKR